MREGWVETTLGDVANEVTDKADPGTSLEAFYVGLEHMDSGSFVLSRYGDSADVVSLKTRFKEGDVLFGKLRPYLRKSALAPFSGLCSTDILVFRARTDLITPEYLSLVLQDSRTFEHAERTSAGTRMPRTSAKAMKTLAISIPPIQEQRRIVDLISSIDQAIHYGERYASRVADARGHLLQQLLEPSDDWAATTLGDAADIQMGQSPPGSTYNEVGDGLPFLQGSAEFGFRHPTPVKWCSAPKKKAQVGDLLVSVRAPVGDLNFADQDLAVGRGLAVVRGRSGTSTTGFLALAIERNLQELEMRSGGGMFKSITKQGLQGLPIFLPSLLEQQRIVGVTSSLEVVLSRTRSYVAAQKGLRTQALESLLSGQHEIPDSYDRFLEEAS